MTARGLVTVTIAAVLIAGCSHHKPFTGEVVAKRVDPAHTEAVPVVINQICTSSGGKMPVTICTPVYGIQDQWVPERFYVKLRACSDKCRTHEFAVSSEQYQSLGEGAETTL